MKKIIPLVLIATLIVSGTVMAEGFKGATSYNDGGFNNSLQSLSTVEQAKQMPDDSWVTLQGNIVKQVGKEYYLFKDSTGEINVEIDQKYWQGRDVTPTDTIQITGEVDTHRFKPTDIEVKNLKVISTANNQINK